MEKLTESQYNILQVLKKLIAERGFPPTVREIGRDILRRVMEKTELLNC